MRKIIKGLIKVILLVLLVLLLFSSCSTQKWVYPTNCNPKGYVWHNTSNDPYPLFYNRD